jgi:hypothetical protein
MASKQELENLGTTELAMLCGKVAADATRYSESGAAKAFTLQQEWALLQTSPSPVLKEQQNKEAELASWRSRAIEFHFLMGTPIK